MCDKQVVYRLLMSLEFPFIIVLQCWESNSGPYACQGISPSLSYTPSSEDHLECLFLASSCCRNEGGKVLNHILLLLFLKLKDNFLGV